MAITRDPSSGWIVAPTTKKEIAGSKLKIRITPTYADGYLPMAKDDGGQPDIEYSTGNLDVGTFGIWHNVMLYYEGKGGAELAPGTTIDWKPIDILYVKQGGGDKTFSYILVKDQNMNKTGWVDSRFVNIVL